MNILASRSLRTGLQRLETDFQKLQQELTCLKEKLATLGARLDAQQRAEAAAPPPYLEMLDRKGLFIVGNARSGTSILCDCLNSSQEVMVLLEADLYFQHGRTNFVEHFNAKHRGWGHPPGKGHYLPPSPCPEQCALAELARHAQHFRYVGDKVALGPGWLIEGRTPQEVLFDFQARYFYHSRYFLTIRQPTECVWSMSKMFPHLPVEELIRCWLRTLQVQLRMYHVFPNCWVVFLEWLNHQLLERIGEILGIHLHMPPDAFGKGNQQSRLNGQALPPLLEPRRDILNRCHAVYDMLRRIFDSATLRVSDRRLRYFISRKVFWRRMERRFDRLLRRLSESEAAS
jgi:hypothetical protein